MRRKLLLGLLTLSFVFYLYGSNNTIVGSCIFLIDRETTGLGLWEPTSAAGLTTTGSTTWATGWAELSPNPASYVARWGAPGHWTSTTPVQFAGSNTGDVYLAFDNSGQGRFVLVALDTSLTPGPSIWFGYSTNASGDTWMFRPTPVMASKTTTSGSSTITETWDFPSIGVNASGWIIVGADHVETTVTQIPGLPPLTTTTLDFRTVVSINGGASFSDPPVVVPGTAPPPGGRNHLSRVVATDNQFHVFVQAAASGDPNWHLNRYQSSDGMTWNSPPETLATYPPPVPFSSGTYSDGCTTVDPQHSCNCGDVPTNILCGPIYFAFDIDARGYTNGTNGLWTVAFQMQRPYGSVSYNNIYICTSSRGCGLVNAFPDDQFLAGTSVSGDGGYWVAYHTFSSVGPFPSTTGVLPLITQAIYFNPPPVPPQDPIGATTHFNVNAKAWPYFANDAQGSRCPSALRGCFASGDYAGIASNPSRYASTPFVAQAPPSFFPRRNYLYQRFLHDPPADLPSANAFTPNFVPYPKGADLTFLGKAVAPSLAPMTTAVHAIATGRNVFR